MYSANCYAGRDYSVGYAVSEHPLGPFVNTKVILYWRATMSKFQDQAITASLYRLITVKCLLFTISIPIPKKVAATVRYALIEWGLTQTVRFG